MEPPKLCRYFAKAHQSILSAPPPEGLKEWKICMKFVNDEYRRLAYYDDKKNYLKMKEYILFNYRSEFLNDPCLTYPVYRAFSSFTKDDLEEIIFKFGFKEMAELPKNYWYSCTYEQLKQLADPKSQHKLWQNLVNQEIEQRNIKYHIDWVIIFFTMAEYI